MDRALNGSLMNEEVTCQDYFKGIYMLKGNNYSNGGRVLPWFMVVLKST